MSWSRDTWSVFLNPSRSVFPPGNLSYSSNKERNTCIKNNNRARTQEPSTKCPWLGPLRRRFAWTWDRSFTTLPFDSNRQSSSAPKSSLLTSTTPVYALTLPFLRCPDEYDRCWHCSVRRTSRRESRSHVSCDMPTGWGRYRYASPSIEVCLSKPTARDIGALDTNVLQLRAPAEETVQTDFIFQKFHCTRYFQDSFPNKFVGEV